MNIYLITNYINGKQYIGRNETDNPNYFGSGTYLNRAIEKHGKENFKKEILISPPEIDSREELMLLESACILSLNTINPDGYNLIFSDMPLPFEILSAVGKANVELKRGWYAPGNLSKGGNKVFELKIGIHAPGMHSKAGRKGGKIGGKIMGKANKELKRGIFAPENFGKGGRISGKENVKLGRGWFNPEMRSEWGKRNAHILFEINGIYQQATLGAIL